MDANQRIGDVERDAAVDALREHMSVGRLTAEEFDERMARALQAKTRSDLDDLFVDLPGGVPRVIPDGDHPALAKSDESGYLPNQHADPAHP